MNKITKQYLDLIKSRLAEKHKFTSIMAMPKLEKIVINSGVGDATVDSKFIDAAANEIMLITGQKPILTKSKKAIATYKLRENQTIGVKVTLHGENMWNFVEKLINVALPRVRDFKGLNTNSFDGHGNYSIGIKEQNIFTEINFDDIKKARGFDITFVTSTNDDKMAFDLLTAIGLPFAKKR